MKKYFITIFLIATSICSYSQKDYRYEITTKLLIQESKGKITNSVDAFLLLAEYYKDLDTSKSDSFFIQAIDLIKIHHSKTCKDPRKKRDLYKIGYLYFQIKNYSEAKKWFLKAKAAGLQAKEIDMYINWIEKNKTDANFR